MECLFICQWLEWAHIKNFLVSLKIILNNFEETIVGGGWRLSRARQFAIGKTIALVPTIGSGVSKSSVAIYGLMEALQNRVMLPITLTRKRNTADQ